MDGLESVIGPNFRKEQNFEEMKKSGEKKNVKIGEINLDCIAPRRPIYDNENLYTY